MMHASRLTADEERILKVGGDPTGTPTGSPRDRQRRLLRKLTLYRDQILGRTSDRDILTLAGGGSVAGLWLMLPSEVERQLSQALGKIEREHYGARVPEWTVEAHNVLVKAFAITVATKPMPR